MAAAQSAYARLLDLSMRSMADLNLRRINKLCTAIGELRQLLSCVVCSQLLVDPYQPKGRRCDHFVCRLCVRGTKRLIPKCPKCDDCCDYKIYEEDRAMTLQMLCYKTLCVQILQSGLYPQLQNLRAEVPKDILKPRIKLPAKSIQEFIVEGSQYDDVRDTFLFEPDMSFLRTLVSSLPDETPNISTATTPEMPFVQSLPEQMSISDMEIEVAAATADHPQFGSPIPLLPTGSRVGLQQQQVVVSKASSVVAAPSWNELDFSSALSSVTALPEGTYTYVLPDPSVTPFSASDSPLLIGQLVQIDNTPELLPEALVQEEVKPVAPVKECIVVGIEDKSVLAGAKKKTIPVAPEEMPTVAPKVMPTPAPKVVTAPVPKVVTAPVPKMVTAPVPKVMPTPAPKEKPIQVSKETRVAVAVSQKSTGAVAKQKPIPVAAKEQPLPNIADEEKQSIAAMKKLAITTKEKSSKVAAEKLAMEKQAIAFKEKQTAFKAQLAAAVKERATLVAKEKQAMATKEKQEKRLEEPVVQVTTPKRKHAQVVEEEKSSSHMRLRKQTATIVSSVQVQPPAKDEPVQTVAKHSVPVSAKSAFRKVGKTAPEPKKPRKHCRCGISGPSTPKTCRNNRCWCYINGNSCSDCSCQGCNNPHKQDYIDTDDELDNDGEEEEQMEKTKTEIKPSAEEKSTVTTAASAPPPSSTSTVPSSQPSSKGLTLVALSNPEQSKHPLVLVQNENNEMQCFNIFQDDVPIDPANYGFQRVQLQNKDSGNSSIPQYAYMAMPPDLVDLPAGSDGNQSNAESTASPEAKKFKSIQGEATSNTPACPGDSLAAAAASAHSLFEDIMSGSDDL